MTTTATSRRHVFVFSLVLGATAVSTAPAQCFQSPPGLIHWWPGDRTSADVVGGSHGTLHNGVDYAAQVGSAFVFDGLDDLLLTTQNSTLTGNPSFTIEAWIYVPSSSRLTGPTYPPILWWGTSATGSSVFFGLQGGHRNKLFVGFFNGGEAMSGTFTNDEWHHVAWVRNGGVTAHEGNTLYIDGVSVDLVDDIAATIVPNVTASPYFMQSATDGRFFEGMVDELSIYNRALSSAEVRSIFDAGTAGKCKPGVPPGPLPSGCAPVPPGLISWWPGDGNADDIVGGNHGSLIGGRYAAKVGTAFVFDGFDDYLVSDDNSTLTGNPSFTIEGWIFVPSAGNIVGPGYPSILWWGSLATGKSVYFSLRSNEKNRLFVGFYNGGQYMAGTFTNDEWHHVAWVRNGGGAANQGNTLYVDGVSVPLLDDPNAPSNSATPDVTASPYYMQSGSDGRHFEGMFDELGVYNRALTPGEVQGIYNADGAGRCKGGYDLFGTGCAGTAGVPTLDAPLWPWIGSPFAVDLGNLPPGSGIAYVIFGFSNTSWSGIPLPGDLSLLGLPGCTVYTSVEVAFPVLATGGTAQLAFLIPSDPSLQGLRFFNQGVALDPPANLFGAVVSNAGSGVIGMK